MYKFFKEDLDALDFKIKELRATIREAGQQMGAATEDGEREHDNPELDDAMRKHLRDMNEIRGKAEIVNLSEVRTERVSVGCDVSFVDQDGDEKTISIGSFMPSEASTAISYNAPIAKILIGLKVGEYREGTIAGKHVEFEVLSIKITPHH